MRRPRSERVYELTVLGFDVVLLLDEVQAVLHEAKRQGPLHCP